jgi:translation elongation factor EF-1beta
MADNDEVDLFAEETEDEKQTREVKDKELKEKPKGKITKSQLILDVKPLDDEVNLDELEGKVRALEFPTLVWGAAHKEPIAYGLNALRIIATIHDDSQVSVDDVEDAITNFEELVSSISIVAWNKL